MREQVEAKLTQSQEQLAIWQRNLMQAQEQCQRWDAIRLVCGELLAADVEEDSTKQKDP